MKIIYNGYPCQEGSTSLEVRKATQQGQFGPTITTVAFVVRGFVRAPGGPSLLTPEMLALQAAFSVHGGDIKLQHGGVDTAHVMLNSATISGTRISRFAWINSRPTGAEYVERRSWMAIVTGEFKARDSGLVSWNESVRIIGTGGPVVVWQPTLVGPPQPQMTQQQSSVVAFQRGSAVGISDYPVVPDPVFSAGLIKSRPTWQEVGSPQLLGTTPFGYRTNWFYVYEGLGFTGGTPVLP